MLQHVRLKWQCCFERTRKPRLLLEYRCLIFYDILLNLIELWLHKIHFFGHLKVQLKYSNYCWQTLLLAFHTQSNSLHFKAAVSGHHNLHIYSSLYDDFFNSVFLFFFFINILKFKQLIDLDNWSWLSYLSVFDCHLWLLLPLILYNGFWTHPAGDQNGSNS